jgi:citrate lyase subunit beta/citryl-CoA lyase
MSIFSSRELPVWRSQMFVPVNVPRYVEKAHTRGADAIILDLEDSIAPADKEDARKLVADAARMCARGGADIIVRINQPLELAVRDIETVVSSEVKALMLPKVDSASHVRLLAELVDRVEARKQVPAGHTRFLVLVESAQAFFRMQEIAAAHPRNVAISLGTEDFTASTGSQPDSDVLLYPKQHVVIAARAAGILPFGVIGSAANYADAEGMRAMIRKSRRFGFQGSSCIHPATVPLLNEGFSPTAEEIAYARRVVVEYHQAKDANRGSFSIDGKMIDIPIVERAEEVLAIAQRIEVRQAHAQASA